MNSNRLRGSSSKISQSRRALAQPRLLLAMTAMATAIGGFSYLAKAQTGHAPVPMVGGSKKPSKPSNLRDLPALVKRAGATGAIRRYPKASASQLKSLQAQRGTGSRSAAVVTNGPNVSAFNLGDIDLTPNSPSDEREPLFSPDGSLIVFRSTGADTNGDGAIDSAVIGSRYHIWVMNNDGTAQRQLTGLQGNDDFSRSQFRPSWSPDGNQVVYVDGSGASSQLFVVNALDATPAPEQRTFFTGDKRSPAWAPNGLTITFSTDTNPQSGAALGSFDLFSIDPGGDSDTVQRLTGGAGDTLGNTTDDFNPAYSVVDGTSIYFSSNRDANGKITGRRIWRRAGDGTLAVVTDPTQRGGGFRTGDTVIDDFPTVSLARDFSVVFGNATDAANNPQKILTEQLGFETNSRLNTSDNTQDLNIWDIPVSSLPEAADSAFVLTNGQSSPSTVQNGVNNGGEDTAADREPSFNRSITSPQSIGTLAFASQRTTNPNPGASAQNMGGGHDIFTTGTVDTTPPILVPQSVGNQNFPVVSPIASTAGQGQGSPRTFEAGLRPGAAAGTAGSLKIAVVIDEKQSGLNRNTSVVAVVRDANQLVVNTGEVIDFGPPFGLVNFVDPATSPVDSSIIVSVARERGYAVTNSYPLTAVDDGVSEKQAGAVAGDGVFYCSTDVVTPPSGEYYIDIVVTDQRKNTFTYDNIWGFSTTPFSKTQTDLLVSDYAVGQLFPNTLSGTIGTFGNEGGDDGRFAKMFPVESYLIKANGPDGTLGRATLANNNINPGPEIQVPNAFPTADVWRILCRGPVTTNLLNSYRPGTVSQIDPNEVLPKGSTTAPFTTKTRKVATANASVTWASPYTGEVFAGPGTLVDAATQSLLTDFSNAGGRLMVMGRDIGWGLTSGGTTSSDFLNTVLGADWGGDVSVGPGFLTPGVLITAEAGGFIKDTLSYFPITSQDLQNLQVPFHYENKTTLTDNWDDAALNLDPNTFAGTGSDGSNVGFGEEAVGVQPDSLIPTNAGGSITTPAYSIGGRTVGQRVVRKVGTVESRSVALGFGLESINRRYRVPSNNYPFLGLNARSTVVRGVNSFLKTGSLSGTVINASTNQPIANFLVRITNLQDTTQVYLARTDANGNYSVSGLSETVDEAGYRVEAAVLSATGALLPSGTPAGQNGSQTSPPGFFGGTTRSNIEIIGGSNTSNVNLRPIPIVPGSLRGRVVTTDINDPKKQVPANNLYVLVRSVNEASIFPGGGQYVAVVKTDATGNFSFSRVPALIDLEVVLNPSLEDIPAKSGLRPNFSPPAFTGQFQNPDLARRLITGLKRPTNSSPPALQVPTNGTFILNDSATDDKGDSGVPLLLTRFSATLNGKVTVNGVAAGNVGVQLLTSTGAVFSPSRTATTDSTGAYSITNIPVGVYRVKATTQLGATATSGTITVANNGTTTTFTVPTINIIAPTLSGLVKLRTIGTSTTETPLANATVELLNISGISFSPAITTTTKADGKYSFDVVAGSYKLRATFSANGTTLSSAVSDTVKVVGTSGNTNGPTLLISSYQLSGRVVNSAGAGQAGATVELLSGTTSLQVVVADGAGNFKFSNLSPGSYTVRAITISGASGQTSATIAASATSVPAITVVVSGSGGTPPTPPGNGDGTDGGGSTGTSFGPNLTTLISLPYAVDNILGTLTVRQAFNTDLSKFKLFRFNTEKQINRLVAGQDLIQIVDSGFVLKRGQGYLLQTLTDTVTTTTPVQNTSLKAYAGTTFSIPLTWNNTFLSDTKEPDNRNNGWNLIGFPFNPAKYNTVSFGKAQLIYGNKTFNSINEAAAAGIISSQLYTLNSSNVRIPLGSTNMNPFVGYFVKILRNDQPIRLVLQNPTFVAPTPTPAP